MKKNIEYQTWVNRTAYVSRYQDSLFYQMEETLKKDRLAKYNIKDK